MNKQEMLEMLCKYYWKDIPDVNARYKIINALCYKNKMFLEEQLINLKLIDNI